MRTKAGRFGPTGKKALALLLTLLLAFTVWMISPDVARAEEPVAQEPAPSETQPEASSSPEPTESESSDLTVPDAQTPEPSASPEPTETESIDLAATSDAQPLEASASDGSFEVTTVGGHPCVADEVLVQFKRSTSDATVAQALDAADVQATDELAGNLHVAEIPEGETIADYIETLEDQPDVLFAQPNYVYDLADTAFVPTEGLPEDSSPEATYTNDPYRENQWHLDTIGVYDAWDTTMGSSGVRVAVLDTGADLDHPDLAGRIVAQTDVVAGNGSAEDDMGHGTHVAGIISATANNGVYFAGVAPGASLIIVDVFYRNDKGTPATSDDEWGATSASIAAGITYAINNGADVINLSLGGSSSDAVEENAIAAAASAGIVVVAAAGNSSTSAPIYPGDLDSVICVTATDINDAFASSYSNYGSTKDISAPGGDGSSYYDWILSTYPISAEHPLGYAYMAGTSMAAPVVSGVAALMLSANPSLTVSAVKSALYSSAKDLGTIGKDIYFGNGRVNATSAVRSVYGMTASSFTIDRRTSCLTAVPVGTSLASVQAALSSSFGTISYYNANNSAASGSVAATGMYAQLTDGSVVKDMLTIAVKGDVSGDGALSIADYTMLRLYLLSRINLSAAAFVAADVTGDSTLAISDYTNIRLALLKLTSLS